MGLRCQEDGNANNWLEVDCSLVWSTSSINLEKFQRKKRCICDRWLNRPLLYMDVYLCVGRYV